MRDDALLEQRTIPDFDRQLYIHDAAEGFLLDRKAQRFSPGTLVFYRRNLGYLLDFCDGQVIAMVEQITPDNLRRFLLHLEETGHNPGGVHAAYRTARAFLRWWESEFEPPGWRNPIRKVKAPKVKNNPLPPVDIDDVRKIISTCRMDMLGKRDRAIFLTMLDTGVRASELLALNVGDLSWMTGELIILHGKGDKSRTAFLGQRSRRAVRAYLRERKDFTDPALWVMKNGRRLSYSGLRDMFTKRSRRVGVAIPERHAFRRFFALTMLRGGVDVFSLQRLMGHADLQVLRRYLAQVNDDLRAAHQKGSPVDNLGL